MTKTPVTRRALLRSAAATTGLAALGLPAGAFAQSEIRLRMFWWGAKERADRTEKANQLFQKKHPGIAITGETLGWGDYWPRVATQVAGRNAADVLQMDYRYIFEYARRGALLPLDAFVPATLNLGDFSTLAIDAGKVDGKLYGVSLGLNSVATIYDKAFIQSLGLKEPSSDMSWAELGDLAVEITKAARRPGYFGMPDAGRYEPALEVWVRQRGKLLYTEDGKLGFDEADMAEWFSFWNELRKRGGAAAPEVQALDMGEIDTGLLTQGKSAMAFANSNQLVGYQAVSRSRLGMTMYPSGGAGAKPGQYLKPAMLWSVSARSKEPKAAVQVIDFYMNDMEGNLILGVERGVPASAAVRAAVEPTLDELGRAMAQYIAFIGDKVGPLPAPPPSGAGEIQSVLRRVNEQIGFGRQTPAEGAKQFMIDAKAILARG